MDDWKPKKLGDLCDFVRGPFGGSLKKSCFVDDGYAVYEQQHAIKNQFKEIRYFVDRKKFDEMQRFELFPGDLIMSCSGTMGKTAIVPNNIPQGIINQALLKLTVKGELIIEFLKHWMESPDFQMQLVKHSKGVAIKNVASVKVLKKIEVPLPPLPEQKRIVTILDEAFAGITQTVANAEKNLANARELFESYLNSVFSQKGEGWTEKQVGEIADHCLGKMLDKKKNKGFLKPYLRNLNVRWFDIDLNDLLEMRFEEGEEDRYSALKGDLLICEGGYPGRAAIWQNDEPIFFQKAIHRVRFKEPLHNRWLMYFLYLSDATGNLRQYFTGAGIQHFTGQALKRFQLPVAPLSEISLHLTKFDLLFKETKRLETIYQKKLSSLAELKQSILQKAFSGKLSIDKVNQQLVN